MGCLLIVLLFVGLIAIISVPFAIMVFVGMLLVAFGLWIFKFNLFLGIGYVLIVMFIIMCC